MSAQHIARSIEDDLAMIDFDALRMRRVMSKNDIGAGINQLMGESIAKETCG